MPDFLKHILFYFLLFAVSFFPVANIPTSQAYEGIEKYYVRYEVKTSKNKISSDNLLMIPAKNEFRAEKFSQQAVTGAISAAPGESESLTDKRVKEDALKSVLVEYGLKSIITKDLDTVISYEGAITTPVNIIQNTYMQDLNQYRYIVQIQFSPIAFPDQWERLGIKNKIKAMAFDFFQLFK